MESCSCWYLVAAVRAAACFHLYCSTKHCAAPCASIVILLHSRTSAAFLAAVLKQARADAVTAAANQAFVQRIRTSRVQATGTGGRLEDHGQGGIRTHGTLAGTPVFETGRFNRSRTCPYGETLETSRRQVDPSISRGVRRGLYPQPSDPLGVSAPRRLCYPADRVGFEPTKRLPVYALSRRVPSAARPPIPNC